MDLVEGVGMVVEQEFADLYPLTVENLLDYLPDSDCGDCGYSSCVAFAEELLDSHTRADQCPQLDRTLAMIMDSILRLDLPPLPYNVMMESFAPGVIKIGALSDSSPVMVTCNFRETVRILREILEISGVSGLLLISDTKGYSVDNAIEEKRFTPFEILKAIDETGIGSSVTHRNLIIPGLTRHIAGQIKQFTGWEVITGPISGFELPLFLYREGWAHCDDS